MSNEARLEQLQATHIEKMERQRKLFIEMRTLLVKEVSHACRWQYRMRVHTLEREEAGRAMTLMHII